MIRYGAARRHICMRYLQGSAECDKHIWHCYFYVKFSTSLCPPSKLKPCLFCKKYSVEHNQTNIYLDLLMKYMVVINKI